MVNICGQLTSSFRGNWFLCRPKWYKNRLGFHCRKLDYCSSVLVGVSTTLQRRLQSVLNAAAWLVFSARSSAHTMPLLRELHCLKVPERIQFRLCVLVYCCLHGNVPQYLAETLTSQPMLTHDDAFVPAPHPCFSFRQHVRSRWATEHIQWLMRRHGTHYQQ